MKKLAWYNELGFYNNPFSIKPGAYNSEIEGHEKKLREIKKNITDSKNIFVYGDYGVGKSTVLKGIIDEFGGKREVIYYNCNQRNGSINFDRLLINAGGFLRRLFNIRKKNMIILLDEAQYLNRKDKMQIGKYYHTGFFKSLVFVCDKDIIDREEELNDLVNGNKFNVGDITSKDAIKLIRKRVGNLKLISDKNIIKIFNHNKNPRAFLKNCEDVCRFAFENNSKTVTEEHIKEALK